MPKKQYTIFIFILFIWVNALTGCYKNEHFVDFTTDELTRLISGDSVKSWVRVNFLNNGTEQSGDPCSLNQIIRYSNASKDQTNKAFDIFKNPAVCNGIDTLSESGEWYIVEGITGSNARDSLVMINNGDTLRFGIIGINATDMKLKSRVNDAMTEEDFEWYNP